MSYQRMWKTCQDYAVEIASANFAKGNLDTFKTSWTAEHGSVQLVIVGPGLFIDPYNGFGLHNTPAVPRGIVHVKPSSSASVSFTAVNIDAAAVRSITKLSAGLFHIAMDDRLTLFFGDAQPVQSDNTVTRFCSPYGATFGGGVSNGLVIGCYDLQAGDFVLTDFEFNCPLYSYS